MRQQKAAFWCGTNCRPEGIQDPAIELTFALFRLRAVSGACSKVRGGPGEVMRVQMGGENDDKNRASFCAGLRNLQDYRAS